MEIRKFAPPDEDRTVFKTNLVRVFVPKRPHTHAEYGGHLVIQTLEPHAFRGEFSEDERHETMVLSQAVEALMTTMLGAQFCNPQDNGNWAFLSGEGPTSIDAICTSMAGVPRRTSMTVPGISAGECR